MASKKACQVVKGNDTDRHCERKSDRREKKKIPKVRKKKKSPQIPNRTAEEKTGQERKKRLGMHNRVPFDDKD